MLEILCLMQSMTFQPDKNLCFQAPDHQDTKGIIALTARQQKTGA
jgi:hypothetical protein